MDENIGLRQLQFIEYCFSDLRAIISPTRALNFASEQEKERILIQIQDAMWKKWKSH